MHRAPRIAGVAHREQSAPQEHVGRWAMRDRGAALVAACKFALAEVHPMREHRAPPGETVVRINVEVVAPLGKQFAYPRDFAAVLRDVRLHEDFGMLAPERPREF